MVSRGRPFKQTDLSTAEWRNRLVEAFSDHPPMIPAEVPVIVYVEFEFARPKSHPRKRREAEGRLKRDGPDIDKLARLVLDALTVARVYDDDRQVTDLIARKRYTASDDSREGVWVSVAVSS